MRANDSLSVLKYVGVALLYIVPPVFCLLAGFFLFLSTGASVFWSLVAIVLGLGGPYWTTRMVHRWWTSRRRSVPRVTVPSSSPKSAPKKTQPSAEEQKKIVQSVVEELRK